MSGRYNNHHGAEAGESDGDGGGGGGSGAGHHRTANTNNAAPRSGAAAAAAAATTAAPPPRHAGAAAAAAADAPAPAAPAPAPEPRRSSTASYHHHAHHTHHKGANERLYEAYSELHCLAQDFEKPFDAPAILVVGHQTDGKSALVEALMGFQFNHVGGGTKTRRPITLHMKYCSTAVQPACFLQVDDLSASAAAGGFGGGIGGGGGGALGASAAAALDGQPLQEVTLEELQEYIEAENQRLEAEGQFWAKEIVVRIEYKYCPNLTIIDTPGLISAAPGRKNTGLQSAARQVEAMVRQKMAQREYIILCLEDTSDWNNATTRRVVMSVDPTLSRTVVVSTKLDTRIPQFATPLDVETFLRAPGLQLDTNMLGGAPFFTSVPSGRVGVHRDAVFRSNEHFREAVAERALQDVSELEGKLGRKLEKHELARIGVHQLRRFLEAVLQRRYLDNVPAMLPLLEREFRHTAQRVQSTKQELSDLEADKLRDKGRQFRESFLTKLSLLLRGTVAAPAERFGETLADEHVRGGAFVGPDGATLSLNGPLANCNMRLYGGAQFHRAMAEFRMAVGQIQCPDVSREEIVNACGMDDVHDGANYARTACVIAVGKAKESFEPLLHQLGYRLAHVLRRLLPIAMYLLQRDGQCLSGHDLFLKRVGASYHAFLDESERGCRSRCLEDLASTTRYVSWSLHTRSNRALRAMVAKITAAGASVSGAGAPLAAAASSARDAGPSGAASSAAAAAAAAAEVLESTLFQRQLTPLSEEVVAALVCQVYEGVRDHIVMQAELKFNCFFLMPLVDSFPARLREELEGAWEQQGAAASSAAGAMGSGLEEVFDVAAVRAALEQRLRSLESELLQVERLQRKFALIHSTLAQQSAMAAPGPGRAAAAAAERLSLMSLAESGSLGASGAFAGAVAAQQQRRGGQAAAGKGQQQQQAGSLKAAAGGGGGGGSGDVRGAADGKASAAAAKLGTSAAGGSGLPAMRAVAQ